MLACCRAALALLETAGAEVVTVQVPELEELRVAHTVTIATEMYTSTQVRMGGAGDQVAEQVLGLSPSCPCLRLTSSCACAST